VAKDTILLPRILSFGLVGGHPNCTTGCPAISLFFTPHQQVLSHRFLMGAQLILIN
jgi:hypothetical protein